MLNRINLWMSRMTEMVKDTTGRKAHKIIKVQASVSLLLMK